MRSDVPATGAHNRAVTILTIVTLTNHTDLFLALRFCLKLLYWWDLSWRWDPNLMPASTLHYYRGVSSPFCVLYFGDRFSLNSKSRNVNHYGCLVLVMFQPLAPEYLLILGSTARTNYSSCWLNIRHSHLLSAFIYTNLLIDSTKQITLEASYYM